MAGCPTRLTLGYRASGSLSDLGRCVKSLLYGLFGPSYNTFFILVQSILTHLSTRDILYQHNREHPYITVIIFLSSSKCTTPIGLQLASGCKVKDETIKNIQ